MPIATPEIYAQMLDRAKEHGFAYPAINVSSSQTLNAALRGFADAGSDGIVQVSTGGADYLSGAAVKDMVTGSVALASFAAAVAARYPVHVALHTDHCPKDKLDGFMRPLVQISKERVARGEQPLFQSHMWDGSAVPLAENLRIASELLDECASAHVVMEMEIGVVGGEEDGVVGETACTSQGTSGCGRPCWPTSSRPSAASTAGTSRSTSSSTAGRARPWRTSARRSPTAWSR